MVQKNSNNSRIVNGVVLQNPNVLWVIVDIKDLPLFRGYMVGWCIRAFTLFYYTLLKSSFANMKVGNIFSTLMLIPKGFVFSWRAVSFNLNSYRFLAQRTYAYLSDTPHMAYYPKDFK